MNWRATIESLPPGLTFSEAALRLARPYYSVRAAIHKYGYQAVDGRGTGQDSHRKIRVEDADWTKSNIEIARKFLVSKERVRVIRKKLNLPRVESRGRKRKHQNTQQ